MTTITPGTGGTLKSPTAEGQMIEIISYLKKQELNTTVNTTNANNVTGSFTEATQIFTGSFSIPIGTVADSSGVITLQATNYLPTASFSAGTGGTFTSNNPAQYLLEVATFLQNTENNATKNTQQHNYISFTFDGDTSVYSGTVSLPISMQISSTGGLCFTAVEYLN